MSKGAGCLPDDMEANFDEKIEEIDNFWDVGHLETWLYLDK